MNVDLCGANGGVAKRVRDCYQVLVRAVEPRRERMPEGVGCYVFTGRDTGQERVPADLLLQLVVGEALAGGQ